MLHQFIKFQTHFGMFKASKMGLALNEMKYIAIHSDVDIVFKHAPQVERNGLICMQDNQWKNRGLTPNEESHGVKGSRGGLFIGNVNNIVSKDITVYKLHLFLHVHSFYPEI